MLAAVHFGAVALALAGCSVVFPLEPPDAPVADPRCFGTGLVRLCLVSLPTEPRSFVGVTRFNTDRGQPGSPCVDYTDVAGTASDELCVIPGTTITVTGELRGVGERPLVLVASTTIEITGSLDVHSGNGSLGAGAEPPMQCDGMRQPTEPAGGNGGSFGGPGGGGAGESQSPGATILPDTLRGGCGGNSTEPAGALFGRGGGAVYVIAGTTLSISGIINASGSGGRGGSGELEGGGGGGSGGMIGLDASVLMLGSTAQVFANGGGGGQGGSVATAGDNGQDPRDPVEPAAGGNSVGVSPGGSGGAGAAGAKLDGSSGVAPSSGIGGGGGGGGGAGVIRVFADSVPLTVSPPAT